MYKIPLPADEPTSGLDSTTAMHLLTTLRELASGGRAVVTTIHQPSSRLYFQLDKLLLLSEGHVMYYGGPSLAWSSSIASYTLMLTLAYAPPSALVLCRIFEARLCQSSLAENRALDS